jgi:hypothetical protein
LINKKSAEDMKNQLIFVSAYVKYAVVNQHHCADLIFDHSKAISSPLNLNNLRSPQSQPIKKRSPLNSILKTRDRLKPKNFDKQG